MILSFMLQNKKNFFRMVALICLIFLMDKTYASESEPIPFVTDATFSREVLRSSLPVVVDFWALWCEPCHMMDSVLEEISSEYEGKIKIVKINIDENRSIPLQFDIRGIPTLLLFKEGKVLDRKEGGLPQFAIIEWLQRTGSLPF